MAEPVNHYPLTIFDNVFSTGIMTMGWLFKGTADAGKLDAALKRLVDKWPLLGGRLGKYSSHVCCLAIQEHCRN